MLFLFFSFSFFKDEEMNRFKERRDPIENRWTPDASKRRIQRRRTSSRRRKPLLSFITERDKNTNTRAAQNTERFNQLHTHA